MGFDSGFDSGVGRFQWVLIVVLIVVLGGFNGF